MIVFQNLEALVPPELMVLLREDLAVEAMLGLGEGARDAWIRAAGEKLMTTRRDYIAGIQAVEYGKGEFSISLVGTLPNIVENGMARTDMHDTLLGPNVPTVSRGQRGKHPKKGGGFYRSIPFRAGTPTSTGAAGQPMGRPYGDTKGLGKSVYEAAKKLRPGQSLPSGYAPRLNPGHSTDIYAGMQRTPRVGGGSTYMTFRTISTGSPGWIREDSRPGAQLINNVMEWVEANAEKNFQVYLEQFG